MHEDLLVRIFLDQLQEAREDIVFGKGTVPGKGDVAHPQMLDLFFISLRPPGVHNNIDPHPGKSVESLARWLAAAIEHGRNLAKVRHAFE